MKGSWIPCSTSVVLYALFLGLLALAVSGKCKYDEVEICFKDSSKGCFCRTCLSCPPGYGPSKHCGGQYQNGTKITCVPCINSVTYSEEHSISSCQPCPQCGGKETLQTCTPKRETSCSDKCKKGYIMSTALDDCIPDPSFMATSRHINTAKLTTPHGHLPKTTMHPNTTPVPTQVRKTQSKIQVTSKPTHPDISGGNGQPNSKDAEVHSKDNKIIGLTTIGIIVVVIVVCFLKKKQVACFHQGNARNQDEEGTALTNKDATSPSLRSSQVIVAVPWPSNLCLKDIRQDLRTNIANHISGNSTVVNGWYAIGEHEQFSLTPAELQAIKVAGDKQVTTQGEQLLIKLESICPTLTVTKFAEILDNLGRKDVVEIIKTYYNNYENSQNNEAQIEEPEIEEPEIEEPE